ncbi:MAG TPA: threonine--tRNA ligase, partial [Thermodesulfobacteriota bacterium]|nr:threonine--tRNA ligase [Thermodesulfobacteriota bacterium]
MQEIEVTFKDGTKGRFAQGTALRDVLRARAKGGEPVVAAKVDGRMSDLDTPLESGASVEEVTLTSGPGLEILRHSASHVMAQAVQALFPDAKITIGPAIKDGFYYDFDVDRAFSPDDFPKIEDKMKEIIARDLPIKRAVISRDEAIRVFEERREPYKTELIREIQDTEVSVYRQGDFVDLCRGPHLPSTRMIKAFKLVSVAGAYWRGDERNKMLQRIYGTAFATPEALDKHLFLLEEAKR